jgi:hypothetical protein
MRLPTLTRSIETRMKITANRQKKARKPKRLEDGIKYQPNQHAKTKINGVMNNRNKSVKQEKEKHRTPSPDSPEKNTSPRRTERSRLDWWNLCKSDRREKTMPKRSKEKPAQRPCAYVHASNRIKPSSHSIHDVPIDRELGSRSDVEVCVSYWEC